MRGRRAKVTAGLPEDKAARCARKLAARAILSSRSLTLLISEEICGRFGRFDDLADAYRLVRVIVERRLSDDASDSFTVLRLLLLW